MNIPKDFYPACATVVASIIGAVIAFISLVLSKENKTSEFRQIWIDALRDDISLYCGTIIGMYSHITYAQARPEAELNQVMDDKYPDVIKINTVATRILLRLNPNEHKDLIALINMSDGVEGQKLLTDDERRSSYVKDIECESKKLLKSEWNRVKRGEQAFVVTKRISIVLLIIGACLLFLCIFKTVWVLLAS